MMMKTLTVTMKWNEPLQKWLMYHNDTLVYDFFNCGNVKLLFKGLDKEKPQEYKMMIEKAK